MVVLIGDTCNVARLVAGEQGIDVRPIKFHPGAACRRSFVGLHEPAGLPFCPCVEIGWRLSRKYWGLGYATEAAKEALRYAFETLMMKEVYSFTSTTNLRSRAVMKRLGMVDTRNNFMHPRVPAGNPLREHVLYKLKRDS